MFYLGNYELTIAIDPDRGKTKEVSFEKFFKTLKNKDEKYNWSSNVISE